MERQLTFSGFEVYYCNQVLVETYQVNEFDMVKNY